VTAAVAAAPPSRLSLASLARNGAAVWIVVAVVVLGLTVVDGARFWAPANVANVLTATVVLGLAALGQHLVVLSGGIDLSVGSTATLSALLTAILINGYPIRTFPVIAGMLLLGALIGVLHGVLVARVGLPPFIVTLATLYLIQGAAFTVSTTPAGRVTSALSAVALQRVGPVPYSFAVLLLALGLVAWALHRTAFGRHLYAVGGDVQAARATGVPVARVLVTAYVLAGMLAAVAGILLAARATVGSPTAGQGLELSAITVVVLGGTSLLGGRGSLFGTLGGVVLLSLVSSSVTLLQLPATLTELIRGVVILAAAAIFVTKVRR
jgi:ribose transport system permease protein